MTGPNSGTWSPILVLGVISGSVVVNAVYLTSTNQTVAPQIVASLAYAAVLMGVWAQVLMLMVTCSDPGVVTRYDRTHEMDTHM